MVAQQITDLNNLKEELFSFGPDGAILNNTIRLFQDEFGSTPSMDTQKTAKKVLRQTQKSVGRAEALKSEMESLLSQMADLNSDKEGTTASSIKMQLEQTGNYYELNGLERDAEYYLGEADKLYSSCESWKDITNELVEAAQARLDGAEKKIEHFQGVKLENRINEINNNTELTDKQWVTQLASAHRRFNGHPDFQGHLENAVLERCKKHKATEIDPNNSETFMVHLGRYTDFGRYFYDKDKERFTVNDIVAHCADMVEDITTKYAIKLDKLAKNTNDGDATFVEVLKAAGRKGDQKLQAEVDYQAIRGKCFSKLMEQDEEEQVQSLKSKGISSEADLEIAEKLGRQGHYYLGCQDTEGDGNFLDYSIDYGRNGVQTVLFTDKNGWDYYPSERIEAVMDLANEYADAAV